MITAQIIESLKASFDLGIAGLTDEEKLVIIPKINSAFNCHCFDIVFELTACDE